MQRYSDFFKTLHDETNPTGYLGRGTHCSILRAVVFHDPAGKPLPEGQFADFAVIWDEDHDVRVMEPIEEIYRRGLLSSFIMFGERKGSFTAVLSNKVSSIPTDPRFLKRVDELDLSVRLESWLKRANIDYIGDLVQKTEYEMLGMPNRSRSLLNELKEVLMQMGLHLGMAVPPPIKRSVKLLEAEINAICQSLNDPWASSVVALGSASNPIIHDEDERVSLYLKNLEMLWQLGTVTRPRQKSTELVSDASTPSEPTEPIKKTNLFTALAAKKPTPLVSGASTPSELT